MQNTIIEHSNIYADLAAAAVRGYLLRCPKDAVDPQLLNTSLYDLTDNEIDKLLTLGQDLGIKLYRFKRSHEDMPRIRQVTGFLRAVQPESLVDVGSGRGVFLFPFLSAFPDTCVTSLDILDYRVEFLKDIASGGISRLTAIQADICQKPLPDKSAEVVTMLEVLEHIPDVQSAISSAVSIAKKYVVVSVPSKPDDNPEHIHLLTKPILTEYFEHAGCKKLSFSGVNGHLILIATVGGA